MPEQRLNDVNTIDERPPALSELDKCVHCGFCLHDCPTYDVLRREPDSPRGRIALIAAVEEGRIPPGPQFAQHISLCVGCLACESACPAGVEYGQLLEYARGKLGLQGTPSQQRVLRFAFRHLLPHPRRLRVLASLARVYQRWGLRSLLQKTGLMSRLPGDVARMDAMMPEMPDRNFLPPRVLPAIGPRRFRVGFVSGCVMSTVFAPTNENTVMLLRRAGCEVVIPREQTCCGALNLHYGDAAGARNMAVRNIRAFGDETLDAIVVNAAGCGATLKKYHNLFWNDPLLDRARQFSNRVRDVTEFLDAILPETTIGRLPKQRVTYQDPCHLAHAQGVRNAPRRLIGRIEGLELVETIQSDRCCGSAGIYNLLQTDMSERLLADKMQHIAATGAQTVIAPNPGCILQLRYGAQKHNVPVNVEHLVDLLAAAQGDSR